MGNFFSMENPFFEALYKIAECVFLSILWIVFCIPLFTAGASTTALYYTVQKCLKNDRGYVFSCFWDSFKKNFKTASLINIFFLIVAFIGITDISILNYLEKNGVVGGGGQIFFKVLLFVAGLYAIWIYASLARFDNTWKEAMKNAVLMAAGHWPMTLIMAALLGFTAVIVYLVPIAIFIMPTICIWLISMVTEKVFRLYMKDEDKRLDDELNMVYHNDYGDAGKGKAKNRRKDKKRY